MLGGPEGVGLAVPGGCPWHPRVRPGGAGWWEWAVRRCAHKGNRCVLELRNGGPGPGRGFGADPPHSEIVYAEHAADDPERWVVHESVLTYRDQAHRDRVFEGLVRRMLLGAPNDN